MPEEQPMARRPTKDDETSAHCGGEGAATGGLEGQEHGWGQEDTANGREHAHGDVWDVRLEIVLSNVLEVEAPVEAGEPAEEGNHELGERGVYVHEEFALDVFGSEAAEAVAMTWLAGARQKRGRLGWTY